MDELIVGGIKTVRTTRAELAHRMVLDCIAARTGQLKLPRIVTSSNGSVIYTFHMDKEFRDTLLNADIIDADGMSLVWSTRLLCRRPLAERCATTDFIGDACAAATAAGINFYLLGSKPGRAEQAAKVLRLLHPGLQIVGTHDGYFRREQEERLCGKILKSGAEVLWVGLGSPLQEEFAVRNRHRLAGLTWIRTCGGLFDHLTAQTKRAPNWVQTAGFEWVVRAIQEPKRLGPRYLKTNPVALYHLLTKTYDPG